MTSPRVAIITGAARGIGAATALRLARDGMAIAVLDLDAELCMPVVEAIVRDGGRALPVGADVSSEEAVADAVDRVSADLGAPTVLVNNAGILRDNLLFRMTLEDWEAVMSVHMRGAFLMSRAVQAHMVTQRWGRIVNLSSISGLGNRGQVNYSAAKSGLEGFTKTLALELGQFAITANAVAPGFIASDMTRATAERMGVPFDEFLEAAARETAVRRAGTPDDVANAIAFLVSDDASFISGQVLYVAGGPTT